MIPINRTVRLTRRPPPGPIPADTWLIADEPVRLPQPGEVFVEILYISIEPPMRHWISETKAGFFEPVAIGDVMRSTEGVARVIESRASGWMAGDMLAGSFGVQRYWTGEPATLRRVASVDVNPATHLGVLGISGLTAYFGLLRLSDPAPGRTVLVSAAAGAVGSVAGQIARIKGARVVGIAGGAKKCALVVSKFGFDACIDYRADDFHTQLAAAVPNGIDIFFENVGGVILEAGLNHLANGAHVLLSGAISTYEDPAAASGPRNYMNLRLRRARMEGFMVPDYVDEFPAARTEIAQWLTSGQLVPHEQIEHGLDRFPEVLAMLYNGGNSGKLVLAL